MARENMPRRSGLRLRPSEQRALLIFFDALIAFIAMMVALYFWSSGDSWYTFSWDFMRARVQPWFYLVPFIWMFLLVDLYDIHKASNYKVVLRVIAVAALAGMLLYAMVYFTSDPKSLPRRGVAGFLLSASVLTLLWRLIYIRLYTNPSNMRRVLIVGAGSAGVTLVEIYNEIHPQPFHLIGFVDDDPEKRGRKIAGLRVLGDSTGLLELIVAENISDLVVAISGEMRGEMFQSLLYAQERGVEIIRMPRIYEELTGRVPIHHLESDWVIRSFVDEMRASGLYEVAKRGVDLVFGLVGLFAFLLMYPFVALVTIIDSGLPIIYKQSRLGRGGHEFMIYKIRTMRQDAEKDGAQVAVENDPRITRVGNFFRKTRIDEFPQFLSVLSGEMSLIGPRAERPEWFDHFEKSIPFYRARLLVKPGITGWAQVNYGYAANDEDTAVKLEYDLYYIKHRNLLLDMIIIFRTIGTMVRFRGR